MAALWSRSRPITANDAAGWFLHARAGLTEFPACLRFAPDERYVDPGTKPSWMPIMVARVEPCDGAAAQGQRAALHRTYLDGAGGKAEVPSPRKMLGTMPTGALPSCSCTDVSFHRAEPVTAIPTCPAAKHESGLR
jgi:putative DNA primase/helicase